MSTVIDHIKEGLDNAYSYEDYLKRVADLLTEGKSTTEGASKDFLHYSELGLQRMNRWNKKFKLSAEQEEMAKKAQPQTWIVLAEGWCGDAAHSLPIIHKISEANPQIKLRVVLREKNLDLMNDFLTNGGKSIPKMIMYDVENEKVLGDWGPRPAPAQDIFLNARKNKIEFEVYEKDLQQWYNKDKGQTTTREILQLIK